MQETDNNLKEHPDLYKRSIKGGYWVISSKVACFLLSFIKPIFFAHLFNLDDLGIMLAAMMMMEGLSAFTQTGFDSALIQKKGDIQDYLDTAWTAGILKGIVLFLILYFLAPVLATFRIPEDKVMLATWIFRVMGVCFVIRGFCNIGAIYFNKELEFHKTFALTVTTTLADIVLSIVLVLMLRSIWGVIIARLVTACINCTGSYILSSYRPRLRFERAKAQELWKFGRWIFGGNIIGYLITQGDDFFVWFFLGIQPLGHYRYAFRFACTPATHITQVISIVTFPAYSKIQNDLPRLREAYLKVLKFTAFFSIPIPFLIFLLGPDFVHLFLPERMYPIILALQILAIKGFMSSISSTYGPVFRALGKPQFLSYTSLLCLIILAVTIYPLTKMWGIAGTAFATVLFGILVNPLCFVIMCRMLRCSAWHFLKQIIYPIGASIVMTVVLVLSRYLFSEKMTFISFIALGTISAAVYLVTMFLMDVIFNCGMKQLFVEQISSVSVRRRIENISPVNVGECD